jgi:hypothetical protein
MQITKTSPVTGQSNTCEIDVTDQQLIDWRKGVLIQTAMPHLSAEDREFIMTGTTPKDWETMFADEEEK